MTGIYKITNPNGKIYIGQSIDLNKRLNDYKYLDCKNQIRLYNSLKKYGFQNHKFEIITLCYEEQLNEFERDFQEAYNVIGNNGLNCKLIEINNKLGKLFDYIKNKISKSLKNSKRIYKPLSEETKLKMKNSRKLNSRFLKEFKEKDNKEIIIGVKGKTNIYTCKKVINIENDEVYDSAKEVSVLFNIKYGYLIQQLNGTYKNNTKFKYYKES